MTHKLVDAKGNFLAFVDLEPRAEKSYFISFPKLKGVFIHDGALSLRRIEPYRAESSRIFDIQPTAVEDTL